jgi:Chagasin family peptidase inhibitor I42
VALPEKSMTGSIWEPVIDASALRLVDQSLEATAVPRGAPGRRRMTFEVIGPAAELRIDRRRPWENTARETFKVRLRSR